MPLILGIAFSAIVIQMSLYQGLLSAPVLPDDIAYFAEAAEAVGTFYSSGPRHFAKQLVLYPPHSPFALFDSMAAFMTFGMENWATAAFNSIWLVILLFVVRAWLRELTSLQYMAVALCILAWPLSGFLVMEARPDIVFGLVLAGLVYFVIAGSATATERRWWVGSGALLGACLLIKPSALPLTLALGGTAFVIAGWLQVRSRHLHTREYVSGLFRASIVTAAIAGPYYLFAAKDVYHYIYTTTFGAEREMWSLRISRMEHLLFYLSGQGGQALFSWWLAITAAMAILCALLAWRREGRIPASAIGIVLCVLLTYTILTYPGHKSVFFGFTLSAMGLYAFVAFSRHLFRVSSQQGGSESTSRRNSALSTAFAFLLVLLAVATINWPSVHRGAGTSLESSRDSRQRFAALDGVVDTIVARPGGGEVFFPAFMPYLNQATVRFELAKRRIPGFRVTDSHRDGDVGMLAKQARSSDVVVVPDANDPEMPDYLPSTAALPKVRAMLEADPAFSVVKVLSTAQDRPVTIFARKAPFEGITFVKGFLPLEGPHPQWLLRYVRWGLGERATMRIDPATPARRLLTMEMQSHLEGQRVKVTAGAREVFCLLPKPDVRVTCSIELDRIGPDGMVELAFARADTSSAVHRAVLFVGMRADP